MTISSIQNEEANCSIKNEQLRYFSFLHAARDFSKCIKNLGDRNMLIFLHQSMGFSRINQFFNQMDNN